jgi:hypothetical protein
MATSRKDLRGLPPSAVDFYNNQVAPAAVFGGHLDLNRSARWVFRITPDAIFTRYSTTYATSTTAPGGINNWNFAISVGVEYKFKKKRGTATAVPQSSRGFIRCGLLSRSPGEPGTGSQTNHDPRSPHLRLITDTLGVPG